MGNTVSKVLSPITNLFEPPKPPRPRTIIGAGGAPGRADPSVQEAGSAARQRGRGRASTIIAALEGQLPAGSVRKRLLGGG